MRTLILNHSFNSLFRFQANSSCLQISCIETAEGTSYDLTFCLVMLGKVSVQCGCGVSMWQVTTQLQLTHISYQMGISVAQWLRCCVTNRKVAGSPFGRSQNVKIRHYFPSISISEFIISVTSAHKVYTLTRDKVSICVYIRHATRICT